MVILPMRLGVLSTVGTRLFLCLGNESGVKTEPALDEAAPGLFVCVSQLKRAK